MEKLKEKWNKICDEFIEVHHTISHYGLNNELFYQDKIEKIFQRDLMWIHPYIRREFPIRMGSTDKRVDMAILYGKDNRKIIPIEIKLPTSSDNGVGQLLSYMRVSGSIIGILIKDKIYIFYDKNHGSDISSLKDAVCIIPFEKDDTAGCEFVKLFEKNNFTIDIVGAFVATKADETQSLRAKETQIKEATNLLNSNDLILKIKASTKEFLLDKGYSDEIVDVVLANAKFSVYEKNLNNTSSIDSSDKAVIGNKSITNLDVYTLDGVNSSDMIEFIRKVIGKYISLHPDMSFDELQRNLSVIRNGTKNPIIEKLEIIKNIKEKRQRCHYSIKSENIFTSGDGIKFAIYGEWYYDNSSFGKVLKFAKSEKYI